MDHAIRVKNCKLHYIEAGEGDPILFLHGVPTSSLVWRNVIPELTHIARCIAPDLIGFGKSDRPNINYTVHEHIDYINSFIEKLNLRNITLVMHGLGSVIGLNYAANHQDNIKGLAFYEGHIHPETDWNTSLPIQQLLSFIESPAQLHKAIIKNNYFMKKIFLSSMSKFVPQDIITQYQEPFLKPQNRQPLLQYVSDLISNSPNTPITKLINKYTEYLKKSTVPKLLLYSVPGFITSMETVKWCKENFPNLEIADLGEELHFAQESNPSFFAENILHWYLKNNSHTTRYLQLINKNLRNHTQ